MRNIQTSHDFGRNDFVKGLLLERIASALHKAPFAVDDLPALFQKAIRCIVRRAKVKPIFFYRLSKEDVTHIIGEEIVKEIDLIPSQARILGANPVMIRKAETIATE